MENQNDHCIERLISKMKVLLYCDATLRGDNLIFGGKFY